MTRITRLAAALAALAISASTAVAQNYPNRPITWVVPFAPGGVTDTSARVVAKAMSEKLGQPVLVENRPGAGGIVGTEYVAGLKPDGYTFLYASSGPMAVNPSLYKGKLKYDPLKSLTPVHAMAESRMLLLVNPNKPYKTLPELIDYAKKNPGKVNYGSPGSGTAQHLSVELLKAEAGIDLTHVPYKVGATQLADLMSGVLDFAIEYPVVVKPHVEAGKLIPIGMTGPKRFTNYPNVPSIVELGFPNAQNAGWSTIALPPNAPDDVVKKLGEAMRDALKDPAIVQYYANNDSVVMGDIGPDKIRDFISREIEKFRVVVERSGATPE